MRFNRVLLVSPSYKQSVFGAVWPPVGLGYLAESLKKNNIEYDVLDMRLGYGFTDLQKKISSFNPDLIAFSLMTIGYQKSYDLIAKTKDSFNIPIVVGGPHVSNLRSKVLADCKAIDFGIFLEGELAIVELCGEKSLREINGLIFRSGRRITQNPERAFVSDLDSLPFPKYEKFELKKYLNNEMPLFSSRGCPFSCIYCPVKTTIGRTYRKRSVGNILGEIEYWFERGYRTFSFLDDNFTLDKKRVKDFCNSIINGKMHGLKFNCSQGIRADCVDRELLSLMKKAGFIHLGIGVEAGNNKVLGFLKKGETIETIERAIKDATELGFSVQLFFLVGSPGETAADVIDSINLAQRYNVTSANFYNIIPYPNTELFEYLEKNSLFVVPPEEYLNSVNSFLQDPCFETPELSIKKRRELLSLTKEASRSVFKKAIMRKLGFLPLVNKPIAELLSTDFFQAQIMHNALLRRAALLFRG